MRKITLLMTLFCMLVGTVFAQAQPQTGKYYRIKDNTSGKYLTIRSYDVNSGGAYGTVPVLVEDTYNHDQVWELEAVDTENNQYKLHSLSGYYLQCRAWNCDALSNGGSTITIEKENVSAEEYILTYDHGGDKGVCYFKVEEVSADNGTAHPFCDAGSSAKATWIFEEVDVVNITYIGSYNEVKRFEEVHKAIVGENYPALQQELPYGIDATQIPNGNVSQAETIQLTLTDNLPFKAATTFDDIEHWYYVKMHTNTDYTKYIDYPTGNSYIEWVNSSVNFGDVDSYLWAFIGNPYDGFLIVNKNAGLDKAVVSTGTGDATMDTGGTRFEYSASSVSGNNLFCMKYPGGDYLNAQSGRVKHWSANDPGSTFMLEEADVTGVTELTAELAAAKVWQSAIGKKVGNISETSASSLNTAISNAEKAITAKDGCFNCIVDLRTAISELETIQPGTSAYYRIVSACDNNNDSRAGQRIYVDNIGEMHFAAVDASVTTPLGSVFRFDAADNGKFYIYSVERGTYLQDVTYGGRALATETNKSSAKAVTITNMGYENRVSLRPDGQNMIHAQASGAKIVGWDNNDYNQASAWKLEEVEDITSVERNVTISAAGWSTLCLGYNATIPAGVEAYAVSSVEGNVANLELVTDVLPAKCPVLIKGEAAPHNFAFTTSTAEAPAVNELRGTILNTYVAPEANTTAYVLANGDNGVGMYVAALNKTENGSNPAEGETGTHFLNNANKAYLPVQTTEENTARSLVFSFGGEETAIKDINGVENSGKTVIYDLSGRRVQKLGKGLYIVNGKKVVM